MDGDNRYGIFLLDVWVLNGIVFKLPEKEYLHVSVGLGIGLVYGIGDAIQDVDHHNCPHA